MSRKQNAIERQGHNKDLLNPRFDLRLTADNFQLLKHHKR